MCGRYHFGDNEKEYIEKTLDVYMGDAETGDITPGMSPAILYKSNGIVNATNMFWGIDKPEGKGLIINARTDGVLKSNMFRDSILNRRLIIPASAFYEWDKEKNKVTFQNPDSPIIYLAGFYTLSKNIDKFVILTTEANESMIPVHDRMPLMINENDIEDWIFENGKIEEFLHSKMPQLKKSQEYKQLSLF